MKNKKLVIVGTAAFAEVVYWYFKEDSEYEVVGFTANESYIDKEEILGLPLVPFETVEQTFDPKEHDMFVAVGYVKLNKIRAKMCAEAKEKGYHLASYVHSGIKLWPNNKVGENSFIFEDNTIQPFVEIGDNNILWSGNHIGHHTTIANDNFIASHVVISGFVKIGSNNFIGVNATFRDNMSVGNECIIGAGALLLKNVEDKEVYPGQRTKPLDKDSTQIDF